MGEAWLTFVYASIPMSVYGFPPIVHVYDAGSDAPASLYQTCAWNTFGVPAAATVSRSRVQPAGAVTVTGSASISRLASSRSPATTPAGLAAVKPLVTVELLRNVAGAVVVVNVRSPDAPVWPNASRLR